MPALEPTALAAERRMRGRQMLKVHGFAEELEVSRNHAHLFQQMWTLPRLLSNASRNPKNSLP